MNQGRGRARGERPPPGHGQCRGGAERLTRTGEARVGAKPCRSTLTPVARGGLGAAALDFFFRPLLVELRAAVFWALDVFFGLVALAVLDGAGGLALSFPLSCSAFCGLTPATWDSSSVD